MHCRETTKDPLQFRQEIDAILGGTSTNHRPKDGFDFTGFVFFEANFSGEYFTQNHDFSFATFTQKANFFRAVFSKNANVNANFSEAHFIQDADFSFVDFAEKADFSGATFTQKANFLRATFPQDANFSGATFTQNADFSGEYFTQNVRDLHPEGQPLPRYLYPGRRLRAKFVNANFSGATFTQNADFSFATFTQKANFSGATFTQNADFSGATFPQHADFSGATFTQDANFSGATFTQNADFRGTEFRQPELVRFRQVNQKEDAPRLRARFVNCRVEAVQFADVNWHRPGGRLVLQDELDLTDPPHGDLTHELVAIAYRQLVSNFEKERAYDLAEECKIGAMEMKRLDPKNFLFPKKWRWLRWLGENISAAGLYRWTSRYGTSYTRALLVLFGLLVIFALLFALPWSAIQREKPSLPPQPFLRVLHRLGAGLFHSLEVATFQRDSLYGVPTRFGHFASTLETILVPAQLALFLLALRRRFRY